MTSKSIANQNPWIDFEPTAENMADSLLDNEFTTEMDINEKLLLEAQNESSRSTSKSSRCDSSSPKTPKSPIETAVWLSYWSSRIEAEPPKEWNFPHTTDPDIVDDNEHVQTKIIEKKHMPYLIITNCASFLLGMGIMYLFVRRYLRMKTPYFYALD